MNCPLCGEPTRQEGRTHHYKESGLPNVYIEGVAVDVCVCGEEFIQLPGIEEINLLIGKNLLAKERPLSGEEIKFLRKWLGHTSEEFAGIIGVGRATISRWENKKTPIHKLTDRLIKLYVGGVKGIPQQIDSDDLFPSTPLPLSESEERIELQAQEVPCLTEAFFSTDSQDLLYSPSCYKAVKGTASRGISAANQELAQAA